MNAFQQLIQDTMQRGLAEAKRIFSIPGMPTDEPTKVYVKAIVCGQASTIIGEVDRFLFGFLYRKSKPGEAWFNRILSRGLQSRLRNRD
jgi:hypothetical protein